MKLTKASKIISLVIGIFTLTSAFAIDTSAKTDEGFSILYVMSASSGSITQNGKSTQLTLHEPNSSTIWFADRPIRQAGKISTNDVINQWGTTFKTSEPNFALTHVLLEDNEQGNAVPIEVLAPPTYLKNGDIVFEIKGLDSNNTPPTGKLSEVNLFIDHIWSKHHSMYLG